MRRTLVLLLSTSLVAAACSSGAEPTTTTTAATTVTSTTTTLPSTTTTAATTTTSRELATVTTDIAGSDDNALDAAIASVYAAALNPGQAVYGNLPAGLLASFSDRQPATGNHPVSGVAHRGRILDTDIVVAVTNETDVVLLVGQFDESRWEVVGAKLTSLDEPAWYGDEPTQILVIGSDARPGGKVEGHRADSIHILNSIPATGESSIIGIPRDSWVEVSYEGVEEVDGMDKITHTMASRGPEFTVEAVETLTEVEIDGYLLTGFLGFTELVDEFGGFIIDVPYRMNDRKSFSNLFPGEQHLDGTEALAFSRNRVNAPGGDFGRSFNHGSVMIAVLREMQAQGGVERVPLLLMILMNHVQTDMTAAQLLNMAAATYEVEPDDVTNLVVPGTQGWRSGRSVVLLDEEAHAIFEDIAADGLLEIDLEDVEP